MRTAGRIAHDSASAEVERFSDQLVSAWLRQIVEGAPIRLVLWNGRSYVTSQDQPLATVRVRDRATFLKLLWNPQLNFGEGYTAGRIDVDGDLVGLLEAASRAALRARPPSFRVGSLRGSNTRRASRANVHHHYDLGNEFYQLWLDKELVYTCAYFPTPAASLEQAQTTKMDLVCRKLRLRPGEEVVEAGCGWGALALHMARHYGVTVRAFNLSREQVRYARQRALSEGLADKVEFIEDDYRAISGRFDAFVSIGMLEHVGTQHYETLGSVIQTSLRPRSGRALIHFIGRNQPAPLNPWIRKHIFPGGYPPPLSEVCEQLLAPWDFSVVDVENLRVHYAQTLEHWLERFDHAIDRVRVGFGEPFVRMWRLYLAGSKAAFTTGSLQLFQVLFAPNPSDALPSTRGDIYAGTQEDYSAWTPVTS